MKYSTSRLLLVVVVAFLSTAVAAEPKTGTAAGAAGSAPYIPDRKKIEHEVAQGYERPPVFRASKLVAKELRNDALYTIDDRVLNDGVMNHYAVRSKFGDYYPGSSEMLRQRLHEIEALGELQQFTDSKVFLQAAGKAGEGILLAPVRGVETLINTVRDPEETWETIKGVPEGVWQMLEGVGKHLRRGVKASRDAVAGNEKEKSDARDKISDSADVATDYALKHFGYNTDDRIREWQEKLKIDPYTSNQPLQEKIGRIVLIENAVSVGFKFVPGIGSIGLVSDVNKYYGMAKRLSVYDDPLELARKGVKKLKDLGVSEDVIKAFTTNPRLTPTYQAFLVDAVASLDGVQDRLTLIEAASQVPTFEGALFFVQAARQMVVVHQKDGGIARLISGSPVPTAVARKQRVLVFVPADHLIWSKEVAQTLIEVRTLAKKNSPGAAVELRVRGSVSSRLRNALKERGIALKEKYDPALKG